MHNSNIYNTYSAKLTTISSYAGDWSKIIDYGKEVMVDIAKSSTSAFDFVTALVSTQLQGNPKVKTKSIIGYDNFVQLFANVGIECTIAKTTFVNARGASIIYNRLLAPEMANKLYEYILAKCKEQITNVQKKVLFVVFLFQSFVYLLSVI